MANHVLAAENGTALIQLLNEATAIADQFFNSVLIHYHRDKAGAGWTAALMRTPDMDWMIERRSANLLAALHTAVAPIQEKLAATAADVASAAARRRRKIKPRKVKRR